MSVTMRKVAFFGIFGSTRHVSAAAMPFSDGMPRRAGAGIANLLELYEFTDNKGNMIHGEAPARIISADRLESSYVSVQGLVEAGWGAERIARELSERFDLVVFSTANLLRPNIDTGCTADVLDALTVDFVVLGMGMQNPLPPTTESLHVNVRRLLDVCNRKARIFGVRGARTERWLRTVGFERATALGCPSMYVYPENILTMAAPDPSRVASAVTGGYINGRVRRSTALIGVFKGFNAHYVMQEETAIWHRNGWLTSDSGIYNDATGEVRRDVLETLLEEIHDEKLPFASYRWFQDPSAWRMFASRFDFYLGDRLHGGIVAMQCGVPSILMINDRRVEEIAEFFAIPHVSIEEVEGSALIEIVAEKLSAQQLDLFKDTYFERFKEFEEVFRRAEIDLEVSAHKSDWSVGSQICSAPIEMRRSAVRAIRRILRRF